MYFCYTFIHSRVADKTESSSYTIDCLSVSFMYYVLIGEGSKGGKAFSVGKGGKGSASNAKPATSDAELKLQLGQFLPLKYPLFF